MTAALHVTNGDSTDLAGTGLVHRSLVWFDVLHEGPAPEVGDEEFRAVRAAHLTAADPVGARELTLRRFRERDQTLDAARDGTYVTHAPVPGFRSRAAAVAPAVVHPWRWLYRPHAGPIGSYSAWRKGLRAR